MRLRSGVRGEDVSLRRTIPAGLLDSAMASLATFVVGLYTVRLLDPVSLGAYALFFSAFSTLMMVSARLVFLPAEIFATQRPPRERLGVLTRSLRLGMVPAVGSGLVVPAVALVVPAEVRAEVTYELLLTATLCTMVSPVQDHIRKMLHIGGRSWAATVVSGVQLGAVASALPILSALNVPAPWQPFGALGAATALSSVVGLALWFRFRESRSEGQMSARGLLRSGRWLLIGGLAPNLSGFGAASLVAHLASAQALGYAEGARVLARPIQVLALGFTSVVGPRLMRAGAERDAAASRRWGRLYAALVGFCGVVYLLIAGLEWAGNPFVLLVPNAYAVTGLAATSIVVQVLDRVAGAGATLQLHGATRERAVGIVQTISSLGRILGGLTAPLTGAFAIPLGYFLMSVTTRAWLKMLLRRLYVGTAPTLASPDKSRLATPDRPNPLVKWLVDLKRFWMGWSYPAGLHVSVLGPDGAGKSTLIEHITDQVASAFRRITVFHLRPCFIGRKVNDSPVTDPHGKPPYPTWLSVLKIPYYVLDYNLGYLFKVRPLLVEENLVLFDRYYHDLLVDPRRYRYGGPAWVVRLFRRFVPEPDLFFILDVPEELLLARKLEVSREEVRRQREAYRRLAAELPNAILLDGSRPSGEVAHSAGKVLLDSMHERHLKRRPFWFRNDGSEMLGWLDGVFSSGQLRFAFSNTSEGNGASDGSSCTFGWVALKDGRGYLIPLDSRRAAVQSLSLYNVQNPAASFAKQFLATGLQLGLAQRFLPKVWAATLPGVSGHKTIDGFLLEYLKELLKSRDLSFAVSLGTPGSHRKPVVQVLTRDGRTLAYVKVGWSEVTNALVQHEVRVLQRFATASFRSFSVPKLLYAGWWNARFVCAQSATEVKSSSAPRDMAAPYLDILKELAAIQTPWMPLQKSVFWQDLFVRIDAVSQPYYRHVLEKGVRVGQEWLGDGPLPFSFSHGDFTPWNAKLVNGRLLLFDWEYAKSGAPAGWDLFHFLVQTQSLLKGKTPGDICRGFQKGGLAYVWAVEYLKSIGLEAGPIDSLFLLYLLERLAFHASSDWTNFEQLKLMSMMVNQLIAGGRRPDAKS